MFSKTLLMTTVGTHNSNTDSNNDPRDRILDRQAASTVNTNDIQKQIIPPQKDCYEVNLTNHGKTNPITNFERAKQIIMVIDALMHSSELYNKILQELNHNDLCQ